MAAKKPKDPTHELGYKVTVELYPGYRVQVAEGEGLTQAQRIASDAANSGHWVGNVYWPAAAVKCVRVEPV